MCVRALEIWSQRAYVLPIKKEETVSGRFKKGIEYSEGRNSIFGKFSPTSPTSPKRERRERRERKGKKEEKKSRSVSF